MKKQGSEKLKQPYEMGEIELVDKIAREGVLGRGYVNFDLRNMRVLLNKLINFPVLQCPHL